MKAEQNNQTLWHILAWCIYFIINFYSDIFFQDWTIASSVFILVYFSLTIVTFYLFYGFVAVRFLRNSRLLFIPLFFGLALILRYFVQSYVPHWFLGFQNVNTVGVIEFVEDNLFRVFIPAAAGLLLYLFEKGKKDEAKTLQLLNEKREAELSFLRSQINPHFLFNTLNFLYTKAFKLDENLANSILRLSNVLRYTLKNSESEKVKISEEIKLIKDLIAIFKVRFEGNCFIELSIEGDNFEQKFEPLMLMPFVENAFKHGVYNQADFPIQLRLKVNKSSLVFLVENKIKHQVKDEVSGIGISNLKKRLALMYPNKYNLDILDDGIRYKAQLKISL